MRRLYIFASLAFLCVAHSAYAMREDVLVVVNDNSTDSVAVGQYYAQQRGIDTAHIVHVKVPDQYTVTWADFLSLRDQILRFGICPTVPSSVQPAACSDSSLPIYTSDNVSTLTANTPIRYIVTTRGVPTEMTVDDSQLAAAGAPTSVDNYLMYVLARYFPEEPVTAPLPTTRAVAFGDGADMRTVEPATDGQYIVGRIDGVSVAAAEAQVDRTLSAEANGIYGTLFADTFGNTGGAWNWVQYTPGAGQQLTKQPIYNTGTFDYWRYAFGPFNESDPSCSDYQTNYLSAPPTSTSGQAPAGCLVKFRWGTPNEAMPGYSGSREPQAVDALAYFGSLDGQTIQGGFSTLLNWRKRGMGGNQVTLCVNAADPATCRANSTDPYKEINTDVVGVASGFIGYNFQSFPVSRFGIWPTGWAHLSVYNAAVPVVVDTDGVDNSYSLWYEQPGEVSDPQCYVYTVTPNGSTTPVSGTLSDSLQSCPSHRSIDLMQVIAYALDSTNPPSYDVSFYLKGSAVVSPANINARLIFEYQLPVGGGSCPAAPSGYSLATTSTRCQYISHATVSVPAGDSTWTQYTPLTSVAPPAVGLTFEDLMLDLNGYVTAGSVGFDEISVKDLTTGTELVTNGSFDQGHEQTAKGDYAANFLDRLGGTAFWGSLSHHESLGHSFDSTSLGSLVYFLRGLPLGDAVWLGDQHVSGILYGDPLYSPIAVKLNHLTTDSDNRIGSSPTLSGSAVNGRDLSKVSTSYAIDYCPGWDFYICDQQQSWKSTGLSGTGGQANMTFGTWDTSSLPYGDYTLRLAVTSTNGSLNRTQTFNDYYTVRNRYSSAEIPTYFISGMVTDSAGQPMADVPITVYVAKTSKEITGVTDAAGHYRVDGLSNGSYQLWPTKAGYAFNGAPAQIDDASLPDMNFTGAPSTTSGYYALSGTVKDTAGRPMTDVTVHVDSNPPVTATTNINGYYSVGLQDGYYILSASRPGYQFSYNDGLATFEVAGGDVEKDFTGSQSTTAGYVVSGSVVDGSGQPMAGVQVTVTDTSSSSVLTNAAGYYSVGGLQDGQYYCVQPALDGYAFTTSDTISHCTVQVNGANLIVNFTAADSPDLYSMSGFVLSSGEPVPGVTVTITDGSGSQVVTTTDASGYYATQDVLKDGVYTVTPTLSGYTFTATSGSDSQSIAGGNIIDKDFTATPQ